MSSLLSFPFSVFLINFDVGINGRKIGALIMDFIKGGFSLLFGIGCLWIAFFRTNESTRSAAAMNTGFFTMFGIFAAVEGLAITGIFHPTFDYPALIGQTIAAGIVCGVIRFVIGTRATKQQGLIDRERMETKKCAWCKANFSWGESGYRYYCSPRCEHDSKRV